MRNDFIGTDLEQLPLGEVLKQLDDYLAKVSLIALFSITKKHSTLKIINMDNPTVQVKFQSPEVQPDEARLSLIRLMLNLPESEPVLKNAPKIRATNLAGVLGLNPYKSPYKIWCEMLGKCKRTSERAGEIIEPKAIAYTNNVLQANFKSAEEIFGEGYFERTRGDFFPDDDTFSGMWDAISDTAILEIKTTHKRNREIWATEGIPMGYQLQALLYAYLTRRRLVYITVVYLSDNDRKNPENFICNESNTQIYPLQVADFKEFEQTYIIPARAWYKEHILGNKSPI